MSEDDFSDAAGKGWESALSHRFNLAILGGTGVGKSTLINSIFGTDEAETGIGKPVTQGVRLYINEDDTLGLYDFRGSESFEEMEGFLKNFEKIYNERLVDDPANAIHVVWYCIKASDRRFDEAQERLLGILKSMNLPVILVVTQTPWRQQSGFPSDVVEFLDHLRVRDLPIYQGEPVPVSALNDEFSNTEAFGLKELLEFTEAAAPEGVREALAAAQRIDAESKSRNANVAIGVAAAAAGTVAATPIPVADAPAIVVAQSAMLRKIATIYQVPMNANTLVTTLSQLASTAVGRTLAGALLKFIPGAGSVINAAIASSITGLLGFAWKDLCERHWLGEIDLTVLASDELVKLLVSALKHAASAADGSEGT